MSSKINKATAARIATSEITGPTLLQMFQNIEAQMEVIGAQGNFIQFSFIGDPGEVKVGDLIPELHLSLRPHVGDIIMEDGELTVER